MTHLYNTLFNYDNQLDNNTNDITMETINQLHGDTDLNAISSYYDITTYNDLTFQKHNFNIMHMNSRSLPKNIDNISTFLNTLSNSPDILAITETWLTNSNKDFFFNSPGIALTISPGKLEHMEASLSILLITFKQNKYLNLL